jgi:hypothetical protein
VKLRSLTLGALASVVASGCAMDDPGSRIHPCVAHYPGSYVAPSEDRDCDLGKRTYLIAVPRDAAVADLKPLGLPKDVFDAFDGSSWMKEPKWCWVTMKTGELPDADSAGDRREFKITCSSSAMEIDRPILVVADVVRVHEQRGKDGEPRVTRVQAVRR